MADFEKIFEKFGLTPKQLEGLSDSEIIDLMSSGIIKAKENISGAKDTELLDNANNKLPELKAQFEKPYKIYATNIAKSKSATEVSVIGYHFHTKKYIVTKPEAYKLSQIDDTDVIKTKKELDTAKKKK